MDKSSTAFPVKKNTIYLNHCGIAPLYSGALEAGYAFARDHSRTGIAVATKYAQVLDDLHAAVSHFLRTQKENISFIHNTAEGLCMLADAFPFIKGDEIISYVHEFPSNHYPWVLQKKRGVRLILLDDRDLSSARSAGSRPCAWSLEELEKKITERTRMIALSHVQFTSGFAADLPKLGELCKRRQVHLVLDAAQSMGSMPLFPEEWNIDAIAASGWKWLMGPIGSGLLYTSPALRQKLGFSMAGADLMQQGEDYLDHSWNPYRDGRRFEYSTACYELAVQLLACFTELFNRYGIEQIYNEIQKLQHIFLEEIDTRRFCLLRFPEENSSAILSFTSECKLEALAAKALEAGLSISTRGGYLRVGIHFHNTAEEVRKAASILNKIIASPDQ